MADGFLPDGACLLVSEEVAGGEKMWLPETLWEGPLEEVGSFGAFAGESWVLETAGRLKEPFDRPKKAELGNNYIGHAFTVRNCLIKREHNYGYF